LSTNRLAGLSSLPHNVSLNLYRFLIIYRRPDIVSGDH
jgi:hypothetical protein